MNTSRICRLVRTISGRLYVCGRTVGIVSSPTSQRSIATAKSNLRMSRLRKAQEDLVEQWGDPVRGGNAPPAVPQQKP